MTPGEQARSRLDAVLEHPDQTLIGIDFDGTLAPIVADPDQAHAHPRAVAALARLGSLLGTVAVITGRPARTAVRLGGFRGVAGLGHLVVLGQYGVERWDAETDEFDIPPEPHQVAELEAEIPPLLDRLGQGAARVEHKGRAVVVHTRQLPDPDASFETLSGPLTDLAGRHAMVVEPGKNVLEIRSPGIDKGVALRAIVAEREARQVVFVGDDLGDLPAFRVVDELRAEGVGGLLVCSASHEEDALSALADVVVQGPDGVADWLEELAGALEERSAASR
ncbi:trehalose-phosphatase [Microlunatus flavus]|uniref:Trehalose 6-phosphate phosphatase n=1 Tax=Microlunatus flavus TaxID=1036181 RepID=A0A1H9MZK9_9ACTN|nr:trehalose-phosphatase [Microlunatus flavus]SER29134.1 trehalose 6-phosphate phosphatase [Microlunatus flavus]